MKGQPEFYAPHPPLAGTNRAPQTLAVGAASSAATAITGNTAGGALYRFCATTTCHVRFGRSDVAVATSADMVLGAGQAELIWLHEVEQAYLTVIRASADGVLNWHRLS